MIRYYRITIKRNLCLALTFSRSLVSSLVGRTAELTHCSKIWKVILLSIKKSYSRVTSILPSLLPIRLFLLFLSIIGFIIRGGHTKFGLLHQRRRIWGSNCIVIWMKWKLIFFWRCQKPLKSSMTKHRRLYLRKWWNSTQITAKLMIKEL